MVEGTSEEETLQNVLQEKYTRLETQMALILQHLGTSSGDIFAPYKQVAQLEELVLKQQAKIESLEKTQTLFQQDLRTYLEDQLQQAMGQRGSRGSDFSNVTKYVTAQLIATKADLQDSITKQIQESFPLNKLQDLEKKLLTTQKPGTQQACDSLSLETRLALLEYTILQTSQTSQTSNITGPSESMQQKESVEDGPSITMLRNHIEHVESTMIQEIQKLYSSVHKPGEYGGPLAVLQTKVELLEQEVQNVRSIDLKKLAESVFQTATKNIQNEFTDLLNMHISKEQIQKFEAEIQRIDSFSRDVQTAYYRLRNQYTSFEGTILNSESEYRSQLKDFCDTFLKNKLISLSVTTNTRIKNLEQDLTAIKQGHVDPSVLQDISSQDTIRSLSTALETQQLSLQSIESFFSNQYKDLQLKHDQEHRSVIEMVDFLRNMYHDHYMSSLGPLITDYKEELFEAITENFTINTTTIEEYKNEILDMIEKKFDSFKPDFTDYIIDFLQSTRETFETFKETIQFDIATIQANFNTFRSSIESELTSIHTSHYYKNVKDIQKFIGNDDAVIDTISNNIEEHIAKIRNDKSYNTEQLHDLTIQSLQQKVESLKSSINTLQVSKSEDRQRKQAKQGSSNHVSLLDKQYQSLTKCFYTAIIGTDTQILDTLGKISRIPGWDYICFTNRTIVDSNGWKIIPVEYVGKTPIIEAKYYKWMSHIVLSDYDLVVWVDAYIAPIYSRQKLLQQWITTMIQKNYLIYHHKHDTRSCIWDECDAVVKSKRDTLTNVNVVRKLLTQAQMPKNMGLYDTKIILKMNKNPIIQKLGEEIFHQVKIVCVRDQLAVTYVYYKNNFKHYTSGNLEGVFEKSGTHMRVLV